VADEALNLRIDEDGDCFTVVEGELEQISPDEHPAYADVATIHGIPGEDDVDVDDTDFLYSVVGRIGTHYFEQSHDHRTWEYLGTFASDREAATHAAGADFEARLQ
jgi:hypothetical protein